MAKSWAQRGRTTSLSLGAAGTDQITFTTSASGGSADFLTGAPTDGFTIPSGVSAVRITMRVGTTAAGPQPYQFWFEVDDGVTPIPYYLYRNNDDNNASGMTLESPIIPVDPGDDIRFYVNVNSASESLSAFNDNIATAFIEAVDQSWAVRQTDGTTQSIPNNVDTVCQFQTSASGGTRDFLTGAPSHGFVIPPGVGRVVLHATASLLDVSNDFRFRIYRTSDSPDTPFSYLLTYGAASITNIGLTHTAPIDVSEGDEFQFFIFQDHPSASKTANSVRAVFSIEDMTGVFAE